MDHLGWISRLLWDTFSHSAERFLVKQPFQTSDGHTSSIWWHSPPSEASLNDDEKYPSFDIILCCPGFYDNWKGGYIKQCLDALARYQENAEFTNNQKKRLCVGVFHKPFVADQITGDSIPTYTDPTHLIEVLHLLVEKYPNANIHLLGCSAGGNLAMRAAHIAQEVPSLSQKVKTVVSVCAPLDFHHQHLHMHQVHWVFTRALWLTMFQKVILKTAFRNPSRWRNIFFAFLISRNYRDMSKVLHNELWEKDHKSLCYKESVIHFLKDRQQNLKRIVVYAIDDPLVEAPPCFEEKVERIALSSGGHLGFHSWQWDMVIGRWLDTL